MYQCLGPGFRRITANQANWGYRSPDFSYARFEPVFARKDANAAGLQLADLVARPCGLRALRPTQPNRAFGMVDARDAVIEAQRKEIAWFADELNQMKEHVATVPARAFWRTVAQEIWDILPEREAMHLNDITERVGHEFVKEAEEFPGDWGPDLLRGVIDQRIKYKKLFAKEGSARYRRRRPEDGMAA